MIDSNRWKNTWSCVGVAPPDGAFADLLARYSEPHRSYHTLQHLDECFAALEPAAHLAARLAEVELALWYHDAFYDPHAADNEAQSARLAEDALSGVGVDAAIVHRVGDLILATRHDSPPTGVDAKLLVDVDLAILGVAPPRFEEYERQIRQEYAWVADEAFREGRTRILRAFLDRPAIYATEWFATRLEKPARENLRRSMMVLNAS